MTNNTAQRNEAFLLHKHGLKAAAMCMAMPIVSTDSANQRSNGKRALRSARARLRTLFARGR